MGLGEGVQLKSSGGVTGIMRVRSQRSLAPEHASSQSTGVGSGELRRVERDRVDIDIVRDIPDWVRPNEPYPPTMEAS